ncbi:MAG TPA: TIGR00341 family protein [Cryomorphaceae bacterium]|nr:TIGR00341 family protein [Cryomorphaceae bacterium]
MESSEDGKKYSAAGEEQEKRIKEHSQKISQGAFSLFRDFISFLKELLSIRDDTDYEETRKGIVRDVPFRGHTVYILICSIIIASIGLNLNSPAVIIGAMLIAPLMGPILGLGLALGTNDAELMGKSLRNFAVMVLVSLFTSTLYFLLTPLVEYQPELLARTKPTTLDIFVALFGGAAGIIAGSRKEKSNVIPGVAIATALMPPLCTSGFGLATGNWFYFFGAFYLFLLNSIFICASTVIGVRYLRFPLKKFVNPRKERKVKFYMALFMTIIILPSLWIFWGVLKESWFKGHGEKYVAEVIKMDGSRLFSKNLIFNDTVPVIELFLTGAEIPEDTIKKWKSQMRSYGLEKAQLLVFDNNDNSTKDMDVLAGKLQQTLKTEVLESLYQTNRGQIEDKDRRIEYLENELLRLGKNQMRMKSISRELKIQYDGLEKVSFANSIESSFSDRLDTIPTLLVKWNTEVSEHIRRENERKICDVMRLRMELDTLRVIPFAY